MSRKDHGKRAKAAKLELVDLNEKDKDPRRGSIGPVPVLLAGYAPERSKKGWADRPPTIPPPALAPVELKLPPDPNWDRGGFAQ